jgi:tetratricopeptide (TPR) repeat protein
MRTGCGIALFTLAVILTGCASPAAQVAMALIPDGTLSVLLSHFEREATTNRRRVAELERKGDWPALAKFADENIAKDSRNAAWWLVKGYAHTQQKQHPNAIEAYSEMVRLDPSAAEGWNLLAQEHRLAGDPRRALMVLDNALMALRLSPTTLVLQGDTLSDVSRHEEAVRAYRQALELNAGLVSAWGGLAYALIRLERFADAESVAGKVEKDFPKLAASIREGVVAARGR